MNSFTILRGTPLLLSSLLQTPGAGARAALTALTGVPVHMCAPGERTRCPVTGRPLEPAPPPVTRRLRPAVSDPRRVTYVAPNPKRPGSASYDRFQLWHIGVTVDDYLNAGGRREDVRYDVKRGFVKLESS